MTRREYLVKQKKMGRHLLGVFPAQYPKEILWAMNIVPAEIWDPPLEITEANAHLQPTICSVVKLGLELILQGKCDMLEGFLFPHTCDSIQNLSSVINDYMKVEKPCFFFYHPKAPYGAAGRDFYLNHLKETARSLERHFGPLDHDALKQRVQQGRKISGLLTDLYDARAKGELNVSNEEFYRVIRQGEYLFPDDFIPELEAFLNRDKKQGIRGQAPIILSGVLPNPPELLTLLDDLGVRVAHDDLLIGSRRLLVPKSDSDDPFEQLTESYFSMPPCSTKGSSIAERAAYLFHLVDATGAKGVIFNVVKFCEPEWFDIPNLKEELKKRGVSSLALDTELNQGLSGQIVTRVEAFVEMIT